jgi:hypothetical protein
MHDDTPTIPFMRMRRHVPAVPEVEMTHQQQKVEEVKSLAHSNKEVQSLQLWGSHYLSLWLARVFPNYRKHASLRQSWTYFEYITLPRRVPSTTVPGDYTKAPPGTLGSKLFPAWTTPQRELNDFCTVRLFSLYG